jgi:hypothetical protein
MNTIAELASIRKIAGTVITTLTSVIARDTYGPSVGNDFERIAFE